MSKGRIPIVLSRKNEHYKERLSRLAAIDNRSLNNFIEKILVDYVDKHNEKPIFIDTEQKIRG